MAGKELKAPAGEIAVVDEEFDWMKDAGKGMEGTDSDSFAIPFLRILQKMSPVCDEDSGAYVEGAKPGMFFETVSGKLYDGKEKGIILIPCAYERRFLRWSPRGSEGASLAGIYTPEEYEALVASGNVSMLDGRAYYVDIKDEVPNPKVHHRLSDTRSHYCIMVTDDGPTGVLLTLSSTQIKKSRALMAMLRNVVVNGVTPPTYMNMIRATTATESNDQGSWSGIRFAAEGFVKQKSLYEIAKSFHDVVAAGEAKVNYAASRDDAEDAAVGGGAGGAF